MMDFSGGFLAILIVGVVLGVALAGVIALLFYCGVVWYGLAAIIGGVVGAAVYSAAQKLV